MKKITSFVTRKLNNMNAMRLVALAFAVAATLKIVFNFKCLTSTSQDALVLITYIVLGLAFWTIFLSTSRRAYRRKFSRRIFIVAVRLLQGISMLAGIALAGFTFWAYFAWLKRGIAAGTVENFATSTAIALFMAIGGGVILWGSLCCVPEVFTYDKFVSEKGGYCQTTPCD